MLMLGADAHLMLLMNVQQKIEKGVRAQCGNVTGGADADASAGPHVAPIVVSIPSTLL